MSVHRQDLLGYSVESLLVTLRDGAASVASGSAGIVRIERGPLGLRMLFSDIIDWRERGWCIFEASPNAEPLWLTGVGSPSASLWFPMPFMLRQLSAMSASRRRLPASIDSIAGHLACGGTVAAEATRAPRAVRLGLTEQVFHSPGAPQRWESTETRLTGADLGWLASASSSLGVRAKRTDARLNKPRALLAGSDGTFTSAGSGLSLRAVGVIGPRADGETVVIDSADARHMAVLCARSEKRGGGTGGRLFLMVRQDAQAAGLRLELPPSGLDGLRSAWTTARLQTPQDASVTPWDARPAGSGDSAAVVVSLDRIAIADLKVALDAIDGMNERMRRIAGRDSPPQARLDADPEKAALTVSAQAGPLTVSAETDALVAGAADWPAPLARVNPQLLQSALSCCNDSARLVFRQPPAPVSVEFLSSSAARMQALVPAWRSPA